MKLEKEWYINSYEQYKNAFNDSVIRIKLSIVKPTDDVIKYLKNYNHHTVKMTLEVQDPMLDETERKYLSGVIRPFKDRVRYIQKIAYSLEEKEFIVIVCISGNIIFPYFKKGSMYKNMELNKEYTLEELGL